jgi:hypothetical protein
MTKSKSSRIILIAVSALAATAVLLATATALVLRVNAKPRVEAIASEALGMEVRANRIALRGGLDFVSGQYDEVTVAVIDAKGCARVQQRVHGPFMNPVVEKPSVLGTLAASTRTLLRQATSLLGGKCAVFYAGSVAPL